MQMQLRARFVHLWKITRLWWLVIYEGFWLFLFVNTDLVIAKYGSPSAKSVWDRWTHPQWGWKSWVIGALVIAILFLIEGSFRNHSKSQAEFQENRKELERSHAIFIRELAEKKESAEKALAEEKAKQVAPRLFLEYASVSSQYTLTYSGLILKNDGGRAFNVEFEAEVRSGMTLLVNSPPRSIDPGSPYHLDVTYLTIDANGTKHHMAGYLSGRIEHLFNDLLQQGEDSLVVTIKCEDFNKQEFVSSQS